MGGLQDNKPERKTFKKGKNDYGKPGEPEFRFINVELSAGDKEKLRANAEDGSIGLDRIPELVAGGYKCTFFYDKKNERFAVSIVDQDPTSPYWNACITGSGSTPLNAWLSVAYKHFIRADGDWSAISTPADNEYS